MKYTGKELKCLARERMKGNYLIPVLASVSVAMLTFVFACIISLIFRGNGTLALVLNQLASLIFSLILSVFMAGIYYMYLNIGRNQPYSMENIFYMFHRDPDRVIVVCFVLTLINMICAIPVYLVQGLAAQADTSEEILWVFSLLLGAMCLSFVLNLFVALPFAFSYLLLIDNTDLSAAGALKGSAAMLKGNKLRLCRLYLSFFGMGMLVVLSGFVASIWAEAYLQATMVQLYMELNGELDKEAKEETTQAKPTGYPQQEEVLWPGRTDDYNAEA